MVSLENMFKLPLGCRKYPTILLYINQFEYDYVVDISAKTPFGRLFRPEYK